MTQPSIQEHSNNNSEFTSTLLLPDVKGYVDRFDAANGHSVSFILAMPIYQDEYQFATEQGVAKLVNLLRERKVKPHLIPGRKSLVG